jgi:putative Mn2+ efflux pump MntP
MYSSLSSAPIMTIAGLFIGYYAGEAISPGLGTIGAFFGAFLFFGLGLVEIFNIMRRESKIAKEKANKEKIKNILEKGMKETESENTYNKET